MAGELGEIQRQTALGDDGRLEVPEMSVKTSLEVSGAEVDHRDRDCRLDQPEANEFGVWDHLEVEGSVESPLIQRFHTEIAVRSVYIYFTTGF